jgi:uncharacterized protein (TIGR02147 family)
MQLINTTIESGETVTLKPIFGYIDYRVYLKDYYAFRKRTTTFFSYRYFSKNAAIHSPNFLKLVMEGKRKLTRTVIEKFIVALKLNQKESVFFRNLVLFNQAKNVAEKQEHYAVLKSLAITVNEKVVGSEFYDYYEKWYNSVIRELICQHDLKDDYSKIARFVYPKITHKQAREAIELLLRLKLVGRRDDGSYFLIDKAITTGPEVTSLAVRNFNRTMIELAGSALDSVPVERRHASGITMGIPAEGYDVLVSEIYAFKDRITQIANSFDQNTKVYQLNIQLFPLSKADDGRTA